MADDPGQEDGPDTVNVTHIGEVRGAVHTGEGDVNVVVEPDNLVDGDEEPSSESTELALANIRIMDLEKELEASKVREAESSRLANENKEKVQRLLAEAENYRKRVAREISQAEAHAREGALRPLLELLDNVDRVLMTPEGCGETPLRHGIALSYQSVKLSMASLDNLTIYEAKPGDDFDPRLHHATMEEATSEIPAGKVAKAYSKGFKQGDKVLRAAMVAVAVALPAPAGDPPTEAPAP